MTIGRLRSVTLRVARQWSISPSAVIQAVAWRAVRRPLVRLGDRVLTRGAVSTVRTERLGWLIDEMRGATPVPPPVLRAVLDADATFFGYSVLGPVDALLAADLRFRIEVSRGQVLHALLAAAWAGAGGDLAAVVRRVIVECGRMLDAAPGYPMDDALRGLTALAVLGTVRSGLFGIDASLQARLDGCVRDAILRCHADPEYSGSLSNNHHLTAVAVLLLLLRSVDPTPPVERMLGRALAWLADAADAQFRDDGSHFEGALGYHACCVEAMDHVLRAFDEQPETTGLAGLLARIRLRTRAGACFLSRVARADGSYPTIGDFDGSRILRFRCMYVVEPAHELALGPNGARFTVTRIEQVAHTAGIAGDAVPQPAPRRESEPGHVYGPEDCVPSATPLRDDLHALVLAALGADALPATVRCVESAVPDATFESIELLPDAGIVVARAARTHLTLRDGSAGQHGIGTHSHVDHLSVDLWVDGVTVAPDPGSWVYGADLRRRDAYRGARAHSSPIAPYVEPTVLDHPFMLRDPPPCARLRIAGDTIVGSWHGPRCAVHRVVVLRGGRLSIVDVTDGERLGPAPANAPEAAAWSYFGPLVTLSAAPVGLLPDSDSR
jgi:hypothetical protein